MAKLQKRAAAKRVLKDITGKATGKTEKKAEKKTQVTMFMIMGLIAVMILFLVISMTQLNNKETTEEGVQISDKRVDSVKKSMELCLEKKAVDELVVLGVTGGQTRKREMTNISTALYFIDSKNIMPALYEIEENFEKNLRFAEELCIKEIEQVFSEQGTTVKLTRKSSIDASFNEKDISIYFKMPVEVIFSDKKTAKLDGFNINLNVRMKHIYNVAEQLVYKKVDNPEFLDIAFMGSFDVDVLYTPKSKYYAIYTLTDYGSNINKEPFVFMFSTYNGDEDSVSITDADKIEPFLEEVS